MVSTGGRVRRWLLALVILVIGLGVVAWNTEPPRLLSWADRVAGGGRGVSLVADDVPFGARGQTLDVWAPTAPAATPRPVLVWYYGGGWVHGDRRAYDFAARAFAHAGFVVVVPDYRKVPGVRFPAYVQDAAQAIRWTRDNVARFGGDPGRLAIAGHSAGRVPGCDVGAGPPLVASGGRRPGDHPRRRRHVRPL